MKNFLTIFPAGQNIHLLKDVGMIPYMLAKEKMFNSTIAFYDDFENLKNWDKSVDNLKYRKIRKITSNDNINILFFLLKNINKYQYIMMFHPSTRKMLITLIIKILTFGRVKFYFKLDADDNIQKNNEFYPKNFKTKIKSILYKIPDLYTAESKLICDFFNKYTPIKTKFLPNGTVIENKISDYNKENLFITVGRIGTFQKDTETLLRAIEKVNLFDWKVDIIGPIEESFYEKINGFYKKNPNLINSVRFLGNIDDRSILNEIYLKAKVFVLPSRFESFGIVLVESLANGNFLLSTKFSAAIDIINDGKYGELFDVEDDESLSELMQQIILEKIKLPKPISIAKYASDKYDWRLIVNELYNYIR